MRGKEKLSSSSDFQSEVCPTHPWKQQQQEGEAKRSSLFFTVYPSSFLSSDLQSSDSVEHLLRVPDAKGMRNRPFSFYEDWLILFEKDRATGELVEDSADAVTTMEKEDANATTEEGEQFPIEQFSMNMGDTDYSMSTTGNVPNRVDCTKTGKKEARPAEGIPTELSEMAKILGSFIENTNTMMMEIAPRIGYSHDLSQQRRLVNAKLLKLPMSNT